MFEDDVDGQPLPCDHPIRWYHRLAAFAHDRIEHYKFTDREAVHDRLPRWVCEAYERVEFDFPCWQCEADRYREYGATTKSDADVIDKWCYDRQMLGLAFCPLHGRIQDCPPNAHPLPDDYPLGYDELDVPTGCHGCGYDVEDCRCSA